MSPGAKLHITALIIKREPSDVNFAGRFKDPRWNIGTASFIGYYHIGGVRSIESLVSTKESKKAFMKHKNVKTVKHGYISSKVKIKYFSGCG